MPELSIITGTRNRPAAFQRFLSSILECTVVDYELIVADASDDCVLCEIDSPRILILPERPRLGMARGYNVAFTQATGKWCLWLNDDVEVLKGYDTAAIEFMEANPLVGIGALYYSDDLTREDFHVNHDHIGLYANFGIIEREFGIQIGWFDEDIDGMYGVDNAIAYKTYLAGRSVEGIPGARLIHHSEDDAERRANQNNRNRDASLLKAKYWANAPLMHAVQERNRKLMSV